MACRFSTGKEAIKVIPYLIYIFLFNILSSCKRTVYL